MKQETCRNKCLDCGRCSRRAMPYRSPPCLQCSAVQCKATCACSSFLSLCPPTAAIYIGLARGRTPWTQATTAVAT